MNENASEDEFDCLSGNLSSINITARSEWRIRTELHYGTPVVATVLLIFFIISFLWNLFIIVTFFVKHRLLKEPGNILLLNLSVGDFLVSITILLFTVITETAREFIFGPSDTIRCRFCDFTGALFMFLIVSALHSITALSVDRFILLSYPFQYKKIMTKWRSVVIVIAIWIISLILAILPVVGFGQVEFNTNFGYCIPRFTGVNMRTNIRNYYYCVLVLIESLIVVTILLVTNVWTYKIVSKFLKGNFRRRSTYRRTEGKKEENLRFHKQQKQLIKVFGALFISNIISYTPVIVVTIILGAVGDDVVPPEIFIFGWICFLTTPVIHPIIESFFVKELRLIVEKGQRNLRRASTLIIRQSTSLFRSKDLDIANKEMEKGESGHRSTRKIVFLSGKPSIPETDTELVSVSKSSPEPALTSALATPKNGQVPGSSSPKRKRRITFSDQTPPPISELVSKELSLAPSTINEEIGAGEPVANTDEALLVKSDHTDSPGLPGPQTYTQAEVHVGNEVVEPAADVATVHTDLNGVSHNDSVFNTSSTALVDRQETLV